MFFFLEKKRFAFNYRKVTWTPKVCNIARKHVLYSTSVTLSQNYKTSHITQVLSRGSVTKIFIHNVPDTVRFDLIHLYSEPFSSFHLAGSLQTKWLFMLLCQSSQQLFLYAYLLYLQFRLLTTIIYCLFAVHKPFSRAALWWFYTSMRKKVPIDLLL